MQARVRHDENVAVAPDGATLHRSQGRWLMLTGDYTQNPCRTLD